ncbi:HlyD family type I secretion periplasmic adaptor subunit [Amylibacter sp. SFDW26]|uniref:HlyD family type I secretion periplasmic adaptor subunit n=1 Tax=Amylibacter sp. SFDW26 TaxID=2652722 RepID=UPI0012618D48|nr:HlyD family type I secretion periplasmic adaptor subunit [Amylibacter sp. SFDW26]KAB7610159.1 HlyD family type I secretion periplasmic adaptor subunit [Amylibacter sp. SFDW26]
MANVPTDTVPINWYDDVPRSVRKHVIFGTLLLILSFGGFGYWATSAPLAAAVIAQGSFIATGRNKIIQHLEGGIIQSISVSEGDLVQKGQTLMQLDETAALATERELFLRQVRLQVAEARIHAEYQRAETLVFPDHMMTLRSDYEIATMMDGQMVAFNVAMQGLNNDIALLNRNIDALAIRSTGYVSQLKSANEQKKILTEELIDKEQLFESGLVRKVELNAVKRAIAEADGQIGRLEAEISEIEEVSRRYHTQIEQTLGKHRNAALDELQAIQAELESIREQFRTAENVLSRVEITAPVSGTVVRLYYHTAGGVIESGKAIAEILPSDQPLIIETQIPRTEIDSVQNGYQATVRLTALNQRITPVLFGEVYYVSADTISEKTSGETTEVYVARVSIPAEELLRVPGFSPTPGMPAEIMIQTAERTFIQYLTKPITDSMTRAFREQ